MLFALGELLVSDNDMGMMGYLYCFIRTVDAQAQIQYTPVLAYRFQHADKQQHSESAEDSVRILFGYI